MTTHAAAAPWRRRTVDRWSTPGRELERRLAARGPRHALPAPVVAVLGAADVLDGAPADP